MPIPPAFEVRLAAYGIDRDIDVARRTVWTLLEPRIDGIIKEHLDRSIVYAPALADNVKKNYARSIEAIRNSTRKLFLNLFDEKWVADAEARANGEIKSGIDMRVRSVIARSILSELSKIIGRHHRFSGPKATHLYDVATRVLMLDAANAIACHTNSEFREAKSRGDKLGDAIRNFTAAVDGVRAVITEATAALSESSSRLSCLAQTAAGDANTAGAAAANAASNVGGTAIATEELSTSIAEIHNQAVRGTTITHQAVSDVDRTNATIRLLSVSVEKIGSVAGLISDVAAQTNLLALNATIEAARAGDAGRGFAVVASEVKLLATQTSKATEEISRQIAMIQEATRRSVDDTAGIGKTIADIAAIAGTVAASVEQQRVVTNSIAENASRAATNAATVAEALKTVEDTIRHTQEVAQSVFDSSRKLSGGTGELDRLMDTLFNAASRHFDAITDFVALSSPENQQEAHVQPRLNHQITGSAQG